MDNENLEQYLENRLSDLLGEHPETGKTLRTNDYVKWPLFPLYNYSTRLPRVNSWNSTIRPSTYRAAREIETILDRLKDGFEDNDESGRAD